MQSLPVYTMYRKVPIYNILGLLIKSVEFSITNNLAWHLWYRIASVASYLKQRFVEKLLPI